MECPQCRSVVAVAGNDPSSLPTVFFINGLIEVYQIMKKAESNEITCQNCSSDAKANSFCHTCNMFICDSCTSHHKTMRVFASHEMVPISSLREGTRILKKKTPTSTCQKHEGKRRKLYCFECQQLICRDCTLIDHAGHKFDFLKGVASAFREEVLSSLVPLRDTHASVTTAIARVEGTRKEVTNQGADIAMTITQSFKELHTILDEHEQVLLEQAQEVVGRKVSALDRQQEDLQLVLTTLDSLVGFMETTAENASDEEFISLKQQITSQVQKVSKEYKGMKLNPDEVANMFVAVPPPTSLTQLCKKSSVCVAEVSSPSLIFKELSKFTVCTYGTHNRPTPLQQHVSAELKSLVDGSVLHASVVRQTPSTYELSYTPTTRGRHQLTVRVNNTEIGTFQVFVQHLPTELGTPVRVIEDINAYYIAVGDKGELFVTETDQYTMLNAQGQRVLTVGSADELLFEDGDPIGISVDCEGNVYVTKKHKLHKFSRHGELVKSVGKEGENVGEFDRPYNVRYHKHQVYVCDSDNGRVQVFDFNLNFVRSFGDGPHQLQDPVDIDFDSQGNIYVVDYEKDQVLVFSEDGLYLRHFGQRGGGRGELSCPVGLCVSSDYVYITERDNHRISVFHTSGEFVHSFGKEGCEIGEFDDPYGIAVDQDGFVFVCDYCNSRIQVF